MGSQLIDGIRRLAPDLYAELLHRARLIDRIALLQPIGRRMLAQGLRMPEREVRAMAERLKEAGYLTQDAAGMSLVATHQAEEALTSARAILSQAAGLFTLEERLSHLLAIPTVVVVPGDADEDDLVRKDVGRAMASRLRHLLVSGNILALTGGSTIEAVIHALMPGPPMDVLVLPARGYIGRTVESQAGMLAAAAAQKLGGKYRLLHLPDQLDEAARGEILKLPEYQETLALLAKTDVLLHGIGRAEDMAKNRRLPPDVVETLAKRGAVADAFGVYFDAMGHAVYEASCVGLPFAVLSKIPTLVAIAAGSRKAEAMIAVLRPMRHAMLVTDEGAARSMLAQLDTEMHDQPPQTP